MRKSASNLARSVATARLTTKRIRILYAKYPASKCNTSTNIVKQTVSITRNGPWYFCLETITQIVCPFRGGNTISSAETWTGRSSECVSLLTRELRVGRSQIAVQEPKIFLQTAQVQRWKHRQDWLRCPLWWFFRFFVFLLGPRWVETFVVFLALSLSVCFRAILVYKENPLFTVINGQLTDCYWTLKIVFICGDTGH